MTNAFEEAEKKFHAACRTGKLTAAKKAIAAGVDIESVDPTYGTTPLGSAAMAGKTDVMRVLIEAGADIHGSKLDKSPIVAAALGRWVDAVRLLLDAGVDPNERSKHGAGGLYPALRNQAMEVVALLVERGARIDDVNDEHEGALAVAQRESTDHSADRELFAQLISLGAQVDARGAGGRTPLMSSANKGHAGNVNFFLTNGADTKLVDQQGRTALELARAARTEHLASPSSSTSITKIDKIIALLTKTAGA
jgi:ankyrin repeat protein